MTDQNKSRMYWLLTLGGGIPLTALLTWVFTAGVLRADYEAVRTATYKSVEQNQNQDARLLRLEVNYEHLRSGMEEIKADVKDIKRIVQEKRP